MKSFTDSHFRFPLQVSSWGVFSLSLVIYWLTADSSVSYWDCPEYVTNASRLEIGHPPGNPVWMLTMHSVTLPFPPVLHAYIINLCSGLLSAFTNFFLCRLIFFGLVLLINRRKPSFSHGFSLQSTGIYAGCVAAGASLCYAFCDSTWFSAVEAEVYAMSAFLSILTIWLMARWWIENDASKRNRILILLAYLIGLSLGVHQLNLLCIPVFVLIYLYRRHARPISFHLMAFTLLGSLLAVAVVLQGIMPATLSWARQFELWSVNGAGFSYNSGIIIYGLLLLCIFIASLYCISRWGKIKSEPVIFLFAWLSGIFMFGGNFLIGAILALVFTFITCNSSKISTQAVNRGIWMTGFVILGFSSFLLIMIRAAASPPMNQGTPSDVFALSAYIDRSQYGSTPLLYGRTPYSQPLLYETFVDSLPVYHHYVLKKGRPLYKKNVGHPYLFYRSGLVNTTDSIRNSELAATSRDAYLLSDYYFTYRFTPELDMWFPRITSGNENHLLSYADWAGMTLQSMLSVPVSEAIDTVGNPVNKFDKSGQRQPKFSYRPTYAQNLRFFFSYQVYYMYLRYLLWNFSGRQNDISSTGEIDHGNFITGIPFIDNSMLGDQSLLPPEAGSANPGRNAYFGIPFLIGIIGIIWLAYRNRLSRRILFVITLLFIMTGIAIVVYLNQTPSEPRERDYSFLGSYMAYSMWIGAGLWALCLLCKRWINSRFLPVAVVIISFFPASLMAIVNFDDHNRRGRYETQEFASSILSTETPSIIFSYADNSTFPLWYAQEVLGTGENHAIIEGVYLVVPEYVVNLTKQSERGISLTADPSDILYGAYAFTSIPSDTLAEPMPLGKALSDLYKQKTGNPRFPVARVKIPSAIKGDSVVLNLVDYAGGHLLTFDKLMTLDIIHTNFSSPQPKQLYFLPGTTTDLDKTVPEIFSPGLFGKIYFPTDSSYVALDMLKKNLIREISKLKRMDISSHYSDEIVRQRTLFYRQSLLKALNKLSASENILLVKECLDLIEEKIPYTQLPPGTDFLFNDGTTEGDLYVSLLETVASITGDESYSTKAVQIKNLMKNRRDEWFRYYQSLSPSQRHAISKHSLKIINQI